MVCSRSNSGEPEFDAVCRRRCGASDREPGAWQAGRVVDRWSASYCLAVMSRSVYLRCHVPRRLVRHHSLVARLLLFDLISFRLRFYARIDIASMMRALVTAPLLMLIVFR